MFETRKSIVATCVLICVGGALAASEPLEGSKPDYVVYRPLQPRGGKNADPTKRGDCYNDHFQVIWDDVRKLYCVFWTQGSGEGFGDMHVCLSKSADRGRTWTYPKLIAGGEKIAEPKPRAVWQQPMLAKGNAYLHPCSPCPIYDVNGCEAASGEYVAFIHNAYDDSIPPLGRQKRGPVYMIRGRFDPTGAQPIAFGAPELFSAVKDGNSYYASFTHADGEGVMWFAHQKHFLIGRRIASER